MYVNAFGTKWSMCNAYTLFQKQAVWHLLQHLDNNCTVSDKVKTTCASVFMTNHPPYGTPYLYTPCTVSLHIFLQSGQEHKVTLFQMSCWTPDGLCTSPPAIMAVIEQVLVIQRRTGNKPIVVHGRWASLLLHTCVCYIGLLFITVGVSNTMLKNKVQRACPWSM